MLLTILYTENQICILPNVEVMHNIEVILHNIEVYQNKFFTLRLHFFMQKVICRKWFVAA